MLKFILKKNPTIILLLIHFDSKIIFIFHFIPLFN